MLCSRISGLTGVGVVEDGVTFCVCLSFDCVCQELVCSPRFSCVVMTLRKITMLNRLSVQCTFCLFDFWGRVTCCKQYCLYVVFLRLTFLCAWVHAEQLSMAFVVELHCFPLFACPDRPAPVSFICLLQLPQFTKTLKHDLKKYLIIQWSRHKRLMFVVQIEELSNNVLLFTHSFSFYLYRVVQRAAVFFTNRCSSCWNIQMTK